MSVIGEVARFAGVETPRVGLGCMGMSEFYGRSDETSSIAALHEAYRLGYRHFDTADMYGHGVNELLLGRFLNELASRRHDVLVATKVGIRRLSGGAIEVDSSPAYIRSACEQSLKRLGLEQIDLLYLHRKSPYIDIEEILGAMMQLVQEGKVRHLGLSEVSHQTLERACRVAPIAALQSEYSLWTHEVEKDLLPTCRRFGVRLVAYSPLGRGFLTGKLKAANIAAPGDLRGLLPRFQPGNFEANMTLVDVIRSVASEIDCLPAQVALAWVLAAGPDVHVIPGSTRHENLAANMKSLDVRLSSEQRNRLASAFHAEAVKGERYPAALLKTVNI